MPSETKLIFFCFSDCECCLCLDMVSEDRKGGGVLSLFPLIADRNSEKRVQSAHKFVKELKNEDIQEDKRKEDIQYCIQRFIKGNPKYLKFLKKSYRTNIFCSK